MPGAPNSPPKTAPAAAPPLDELERKVLRRLAPSLVALRLDLWKGAPARELTDPLTRAATLYEARDFRGADSALDQLSVRFAEPRWPTLPEPFRTLRVSIPAPMPPHYDPEFSLPPEEKEARRRRREAERQIALLSASIDWAGRHGVSTEALREPFERARISFESSDLGETFWSGIDLAWTMLRSRIAETSPAPPAGAPAPTAGPVPAATAPDAP